MKKNIYKLLMIFICIQSIVFGQNTQTIAIDVDTKGTGTRIYRFSPGSGEKAIIDLGHFNSALGSVNDIKLLSVTVTIDMGVGETCTDTGMDISEIDLSKLQSFNLSNYDVTKFLGNNNPNMTLRISNLKVARTGVRSGDIVYIGCGEGDTKFFQYSFDLIADLNNLEESGMYGFSPKKSGEGESESILNIKDIVLEQIKYIGNN